MPPRSDRKGGGVVVTFLGTCDEVNACDCCGRKNLKSTVALSINGGDPVYYGVTCAAQALSMGAKDVRAATRKADDEKAAKERAEREAQRQAEQQPWFDFLAAHGRGDNTFTRIESLGGFQTARALYDAQRAAA